MSLKLALAGALVVFGLPQVAMAQDPTAEADGYAKSVCGYGGYADPFFSYTSYEECYASEFAKFYDAYPPSIGGGEPYPGYYNPSPNPPVVRCTGMIDCKV